MQPLSLVCNRKIIELPIRLKRLANGSAGLMETRSPLHHLLPHEDGQHVCALCHKHDAHYSFGSWRSHASHRSSDTLSFRSLHVSSSVSLDSRSSSSFKIWRGDTCDPVSDPLCCHPSLCNDDETCGEGVRVREVWAASLIVIAPERGTGTNLQAALR
ncbi:hypothetical protein JOB18_017973 [Solea senegalensis]|uniref:Uncharacterized protein n=1 Tax=Solea senegalensis TaxID=28829 RepID=A0AAV6SLL5_SOLSE|nr:hypothetical protein JOB18_017973 [Solea senegalensis]